MSNFKDLYMSDDGEESDENPSPAKKSSKRHLSSQSEGSSSSSSSSSESDDEGDAEFDDGYDENYVGDEDDRRCLELMSEKEREQEIYNRVERREVALKKLEIQKKLKERISKKHPEKQSEKSFSKKLPFKKVKKASDNFINDDDSDTSDDANDQEYHVQKATKATKGAKSKHDSKPKNEGRTKGESREVKAGSGDDNDLEGGGVRRLGRSKGNDKKVNALKDLKVAREGLQKKKETKKNAVSDIYSSSSSSSSSSASSSASENEDEGRDKSDREEEIDEDFDFSLDHLNSLRLSRFRLESWCFHPNFKSMVEGGFVRVSIGNNPHTKAPVYRVAQVVDVVTTGKIYYLSDKKNRTNKGLKIRHAASERMYRLEFISNQAFSSNEFIRWKEAMEKYEQSVPTKSMVSRKKKDIQKGKALSLNESEIDAMVKEKLHFRKTPINYAIKKTELMKIRENAINNEDVTKAREVANQLEELEEEATRLDERRTSNIKELKLINERNRKLNMVNAEESCRIDFNESRTAAADPFTRRHCRPALVTMSSRFKAKLEDSTANDTQVEEEKEEVAIPAPQSPTPINPTSHDLFHIHDFELNLNFDLNSKLPKEIDSIFHQPTISNSQNTLFKPNARSLNLAEYKKKRGLI